MERSDIQHLVQNGTLYHQSFDGDIQETHISWVVFTADFALKIKKPVKLSFLDFSTLTLRRYFCEQEVLLNSRFSDIYVAVAFIGYDGENWFFENDDQDVLEYGVVMKRQDNALRMDRLLAQNQVSREVVYQLARQVANFHKKAEIISVPFELNKAKELFGDLQSVAGNFEEGMDTEWSAFIAESIHWSDEFLDKNQAQFASRSHAGQIRDVHGDLHSRNIFLDNEPIIFDCIEFNDTFRQIDVWYEVAFLCMDMEFHGHGELSEAFFNEYTAQKNESVNKVDKEIFIYFKMLRANIRAKVLALQANQGDPGESNKENRLVSVRYLQLMQVYMDELKNK